MEGLGKSSFVGGDVESEFLGATKGGPIGTSPTSRRG